MPNAAKEMFSFSLFFLSVTAPHSAEWLATGYISKCYSGMKGISIFLNRGKFSIEITFTGSYQLLFVLAVLIEEASGNNRTKRAEKI